jgi:hypothetical protein
VAARSTRHELPSLARKLGSWVKISLKVWMSVFVYYSFFVLYCGNDYGTEEEARAKKGP